MLSDLLLSMQRTSDFRLIRAWVLLLLVSPGETSPYGWRAHRVPRPGQCPTDVVPEPGGWNRFVIEVDNLEARVEELKRTGTRFRNEIVIGPGGKQILLEDPDGNVVELFEAARQPNP